MVVALIALNEPGSIALRLKTSRVGLPRFSPEMVTVVPARPFVGSNELIIGKVSSALASKSDPPANKMAAPKICRKCFKTRDPFREIIT
jgi:hypothetical protein